MTDDGEPTKEKAVFTNDQVAQYRREGYAVCPGLLPPAEVEALLLDIERISAGNTLARHDQNRMEMEPNQGPDGTLIRRIVQAQRSTYFCPRCQR